MIKICKMTHQFYMELRHNNSWNIMSFLYRGNGNNLRERAIMEFYGFSNSDFDFFRKKNSMSKMEYDVKKEEIKRHFRELCYEIQKNYHSTTGETLLLDKNFQNFNRNKNYLTATSQIDKINAFYLKIELCQENIHIGLVCPSDGDCLKYDGLKQLIKDKKDIFLKFFKENKSMFVLLYKRNGKKTGDEGWVEEYRFNNNELILGNFDLLISNMEKIQPSQCNSKSMGGIQIRAQFTKSDAVKMGKMLAARSCREIISLLSLCRALV